MISTTKLTTAIMVGVPLLFLTATSPMLFEEVGPDEITVIQQPFTGKLTWYDTPGWAWQGYGTVTTYKKRVTYEFPAPIIVNGKVAGGGIELRFKDGGHARMFGSVQFNLPTDPATLAKLHANYRGAGMVTKNLLETTVNKSVYLVGTLMTSKESYAEKRNDLIHYATDQIQNGVYRTKQKTEFVKDEITGQMKQVTSADIVMDKTGNPERQEDSVLNMYGIKAFNFTITQMPYDDAIEQQIKQQQAIAMDVQTSIAEALKAEQQAVTATALGRANAEKAKWEQETIKAREVTKAEQERQVAITNADQQRQVAITAAARDKEVAETAAAREKKVAETQGAARLAVADFDNKSADLTKQTQILLGEGEAARKKLVLEADGALEQKLKAWTESQRYWSEALAKHNGPLVPTTVFGASSNASNVQQNGIQTFMDVMTMSAAKQLELNMGIKK